MYHLINSIENLSHKSLLAMLGLALMPIVAWLDRYLMIDWPFVFVFLAFNHRHPATGSVADAIHSVMQWVDYVFFAFCLVTEAVSIIENTAQFSQNRIISLLNGALKGIKNRIEDAIEDISEPQNDDDNGK